MAEDGPTSNSPPIADVERAASGVGPKVRREGEINATRDIASYGRQCYLETLPMLPGILPMARPAKKQPSSSRRCAGVLSRIAYRHAVRRGVEVASLLAQAGLTQRDIEDRSATIGVVNQIKFVELVAAKLGDELLGFHLVEDFDFREIGLLYYVAASADTFGGALSRIERYAKIQNDGVDFKVIKGKTVRVRLHYTGVARHTDVHQIGSLIALIIRLARHLTGRTLKPTRVRIMHHIHGGKSELEKLLDADVEDGARVDEVEFPAPSWDLAIISADPYLHRVCVQSCEEALARRGLRQTPLKVQVENSIAALLPHGQARHDHVAAELGMSPRTLARRLAAEDSSFAKILEEVRSALAERYLADRTLPISQIAWLLGYAEISGFTRAFQRWTGLVPSAARAQLSESDGLPAE
jgi:AraC-like DNA-binding protein